MGSKGYCREEVEIVKFGSVVRYGSPFPLVRALQRHHRPRQFARLVLIIMRPRLEDTVYGTIKPVAEMNITGARARPDSDLTLRTSGAHTVVWHEGSPR